MSFLQKLFGRAPTAKPAFAKVATAALVTQGVAADTIAFNESDFSIRHGTTASFLANIYVEYEQAEKGERSDILRRWAIASAVETAEALPQTFEDARAHLMPALRPAEEAWYPNFEITDFAFVDRPFSKDLVISLVFDHPNSIARLPASALVDWNVTADEAWDAAMHNLRLRSPDSWEQFAPGCFRSTWNDVFDATRILLPDLLHRTGVVGRPMMMIPDRNVLLVMGDRDPEAVEHFLNIGFSFYDEASYRRSPIPYLLDDQQLVPCPLPPKLQTFVDQRLQAERSALLAEQEHKHQDAYGDVFFATLSGFGPKSGEWWRTYVTWSSAETLLPRGDVVFFSDPSVENSLCVPWNDVIEIVGPLSEDPKLRPIRYRLRGLPSKDEMIRLSERAVDLKAYMSTGQLPPF